MSINILLTQTHTGTVKPIDSLATLPQHSVPCLTSLQPYPCSPMKLALVSSFITTFSFFFCACCHVFCRSFARSGAPAVLSHTYTHTRTYVYHIDTYRQRERGRGRHLCVVRLSALCNHIFCRLHLRFLHILLYPIYCMSISHICIVMDFFRFLSIRIWIYKVVYIGVYARLYI